VYLASAGDRPHGIAFMAGVPIAYALRDEPWGQRRFGLLDPTGTWVDVVQHIEPQSGFWDPYIR
jgi:hypothetical protein